MLINIGMKSYAWYWLHYELPNNVCFVSGCIGQHMVAIEVLADAHLQELERLVCGNPNLDFEALQRHAKYEAGYSAHTPVGLDGLNSVGLYMDL